MGLFHPDLRAARFIPPISFTPGLVRRMQSLEQKAPPAPDDIVIEEVVVPGAAGDPDARLRLYRPAALAAPSPALLWIHGGGYLTGSPVQDEDRSIAAVRELGITVASVTYRLAPGSSTPAALDDAFACLTWLFDHARERLVDPARIAIGGASAGGGLAAALTLRAHDEGLRPAFQLLVYPMLDDRTTLRPGIPRGVRVWRPSSNRYGWTSYLGREPGGDDITAYEAAARRDDLSGLPPTWIGVGTLDLFHDEDVLYAQRLREAGVPCELVIVDGAFHGFDAVMGRARVSRDFLSAQLQALAAAFGG